MVCVLAYVLLDVSLIYLLVKFSVLMLREAALAMSQSGRTGCPSKRPKLIRHTQQDTTQPSNYVDRHRVFSLQPSGQFALRTTYIPAALPKEDENAVDTDAGPTIPTDDDPWNEMVPFDPSSEVDDVLGAPEIPMAKKRRRRTAGVSLQC